MSLRLSKETWIFIGLTLITAIVLFTCVNLVPRVDNNFFFSDTDPQFQDENEISHFFKRKDNLLIINAAGPIYSAHYMDNVSALTNALLKIKGIAAVKSIAQGPSGLDDAMRGPLWNRLLISKNHQSTNIIVILGHDFPQSVISAIEQLVPSYSKANFHLIMSGPPYIVELIGRYLVKDIRVFSLLVLLIFGMVVFFIFRSGLIVLGAVISCMNASMLSLIIVHTLGIRIGLMTANLATIVFVLTLSHIIFLTYNWKFVCGQGSSSPVEEAVHITFSPSFWSMMTTLLGFMSLLFVPAQPLKELGASGMAGALVAITVAYSIYPSFLRLVDPSLSKKNGLDRYQDRAGKVLEKRKILVVGGIIALFALAFPGLWRANTDPSLLSYFNKNSKIEHDLTFIDKHGGSSPLILVVKRADGEKLDTEDSYQRLWHLQWALEGNKQIGSIISLPVLMAQAKQPILASLLSWNGLLDILQWPQFDSIANSFITENHEEGLFLLRMNESHRTVSRLKVIDGIKKAIEDNGFVPLMVGGIYSLQGHLDELVASSIIWGLSQLIAAFTLIAWVVSRSFKIALAITVSICVIPVIVIGTIGWLRVPLDVISAPASNIALGLGIDSMIHMVRAYRRQKIQHRDADAWPQIRQRFWQPVLTFTLVMVLGFGIFSFSEFPSTQRFGMAVVLGALIASMTALFVMPTAAQLQWSKTNKI